MDNEKVANSLKVIKELCEQHKMDCNNCPLGNNLGNCILFESQPWEWDIRVGAVK